MCYLLLKLLQYIIVTSYQKIITKNENSVQVFSTSAYKLVNKTFGGANMDYREQFLALALTLSEQEKDLIVQILEALVAEVDTLEVGEQ